MLIGRSGLSDISVTNQKRRETEVGHEFRFVNTLRTHPKIFVAHPEHKSSHLEDSDSYVLLFL